MLGGPAHRHPAAPRPRRLPTGLTVRRRLLRRGEPQLLAAAHAWHGTFWPPAPVTVGSLGAQRCRSVAAPSAVRYRVLLGSTFVTIGEQLREEVVFVG
jgi:hypothetical protein